VIAAIHQPNYAPWLGYFAKIARADVFVFLDNVQYSKNNYINRVQVDVQGVQRWLTVPVTYSFGDPINHVRPANACWPRSHLDSLRAFYSDAAAFAEVWPALRDIYGSLYRPDIATSNQVLIEVISARLGLKCSFRRASEFAVGGAAADDRLIAILRNLGVATSYLSGKGGAAYQDPEKFSRAGIDLRYSDFVHPTYRQNHPHFLPGLSILDAVFQIGFDRTADLIAGSMSVT